MNLFREAQGQSRQSKDRLTWVCRHGVRGAFQKASEAGRLIREMLHSVFVVPCSQHVRVEDIAPDRRTWARDHQVREGGQLKVRKAGEPIPRGLMERWLCLRDKDPELFQQGAHVWG